MFVVFDRDYDVFRMDTETGETWLLTGRTEWRPVREEAETSLEEKLAHMAALMESDARES